MVYFQAKDPLSPTPNALDNFVFLDHRNKPWAEEYHACNLAVHDPTWHHIPLSEKPTFFSDVPLTSDAQRRFMDRARVDGQATNGIGMIVKRPGGGGAGFAVSGRDSAASKADALELLGAAYVYQLYAEEDLSLAAAQDLGLSLKEVEVAKMIADDLRRGDIAERINSTEGTMNNLVREMKIALGVNTDAALVRKLIACGVIKP